MSAKEQLKALKERKKELQTVLIPIVDELSKIDIEASNLFLVSQFEAKKFDGVWTIEGHDTHSLRIGSQEKIIKRGTFKTEMFGLRVSVRQYTREDFCEMVISAKDVNTISVVDYFKAVRKILTQLNIELDTNGRTFDSTIKDLLLLTL